MRIATLVIAPTPLRRVASAGAGLDPEPRVGVERDLAPWTNGLVADLQRTHACRHRAAGERPWIRRNPRRSEVLVERRFDGADVVRIETGRELVPHSGMFPCLRGGTCSRLVRSIRSDWIKRGRVSAGSITSSMKPRSAATNGFENCSS